MRMRREQEKIRLRQKQLEDRRFFVPDVRTEDCSTC